MNRHISATPMGIATRNALVVQWMPLARKIVSQLWNDFYQQRIGSMDDGFQIAYSALIRAVELYKPDHVSKAGLMCYIAHAVRNRIRLAGSMGIIAVPSGTASDYNRVSRNKAPLYGSTPARLAAADRAFNGKRSLGFEPRARKNEPPSQEEFDRLLTFLPASQAQVIRLRFGQGWTLDEVGKALGRSRQRVAQIQLAAIKKLRQLEVAS